MIQKLLLLGWLSAFACLGSAQNRPGEGESPSKAILGHITVGGHVPGADLADRFGVNGALGAGAEFITAKNWLIGLEGSFFFGSKVKEDPLSIIRTTDGGIVGNDRNYASLRLQQRGLYLGASFGKLVTFGEKREGLRLVFGAGWAQHRIRTMDDSRTVAQLTGDYKKGYDRLSGGPALQQFVGWQHLAKGRELDWFVGLEFGQAFTNTRRDWDFSLMKKLDETRLDLRFGIRAAITLPFYVGNAEDIYY